MAVNFNIQFRINATTRVIRLTDTSTGFTYSKGCFYIAFPDGSVRNLPDFTNPDLTVAGTFIDIPCVTDISGNVITGAYTITYAVIDNTSTIQTPLSRQFDFNWIEPSNGITNLSDVVIPEVVFKDITSYSPIGSFTGTITRTLSSSFPSTSEASAQTPVSSTSSNTINVVSAVNYYEGVYTPTSAVSITYTHSSNSWLTIFYSRTFSKTFSIKKCPNQLELVAKINTYRGIIDAYKETNDTQFNILSEQYDLVIALYSHLIARYNTNTQDGSEPILRELLSILEPYTGTYTYQPTKMLPFELTSSVTNLFNISDGTNVDAVALGSTLTFSSGNASLVPIVTNNNVTYSPTFGALINTFAQGNDTRFHTPVTIGTANGLSISTQAVSLAEATSGSAGAMSSSDKTKLDGIATGATANTGTVTSVSLTTPAAFTVTGSPVITTGTLAIAAAGTSAQYITGAGALATLNTLNVPENTNLYYTNARSRTAISLTTTGTTGAATYDNTTGVLNIPSYIGGVTSFNTRTGAIVLSSSDVTTALTFTPVPNNRILTINGVSLDLSADRSWTIASGVTSFNTRVGAITPTSGDYTTALVTESGNLYYTDARARAAISLTTTGTSGSATYSSATGVLNIPAYQGGVTSFNTRTGAITLTSGDVTTALTYTPENAANKGIANGYASLDGGGLVPSTQLPSYVDDVLEYTNLATFPASGTTGKIYVALDTNKIYRWSGTTYIEVSPTVGTIWGGITGTLANQTDLQNALNAKQSTLSGTGFVKSSAGTISYDTSTYYLASNPNSYIALTGLSFTAGSGGYNNATGIITIPTNNSQIANGSNYITLTGLSSTATGLSYTNTTGVFSLTAGYAIPTTASATTWDTAYTNRITSLTVTGSSGASTLVSNVLNIPTYTLAGLGGITASFLSGGTGITYNSTTGVIATTITQYTDALARASHSFVAGSGAYNATTGVITIPTNNNQISNGSAYIALTGLSSTATGLTYTNTTGIFSLTTGYAIPTTSSAITWDTAYSNRITSLTVTGSSGASTLVTNVLNIPTYTLSGLGGVTSTRTLTINGTAYDLTADRTWTISTNPSARVEQNYTATAGQTTFTFTGGYTVGLIDVYVNGVRYLPSDYTATNGTTVVLGIGLLAGDAVSILNYTSIIVAGGSGTINELAYWNSSSTLASLTAATYPSLTEISYVKGVTSAIQTQINAKQATISLTTTGSSGVATFVGNALNIPNYGSALSGYLPLSGGTLTGPLNGTSASFSGNVGIGTTSPSYLLDVNGDTRLFVAASGTRNLYFGTVSTNYGKIAYNDTSGEFLLGTTQPYSTVFLSNNTERMRITSAGQIQQTTAISDWSQVISNSSTTSPNGIIIQYTAANKNNTANNFLYCLDNSSTSLRMTVLSNGGIQNYSANNSNLSDIRTKKDIIPIESYWNKFKAIEIVKFKYKDQTHNDYNIGVISQQVESVAPEFVNTDGFGEIPEDKIPLKSIYTTDLYHATIKVLQEAMTKIEELSAKVSLLENK